MGRLGQKVLHELFLHDVGNHAVNVENNGRKPVRMYLSYPFNREIRAYIFNCTAPGGRSIDEWKVQLIIDGQKRGERGKFDDSNKDTILIIGYACVLSDPEKGLWVLFELDKHREFGYSANIQIYTRQLVRALDDGLFVHKKHNKEIVVISTRERLLEALQKRFDIDLEIMLEKANGVSEV
jgi:hypothetical protein